MSYSLRLDELSVDSFEVGTAGTDPNTLGRDCTYPPVCPRTDTTDLAIAVGGEQIGRPRTMEPGCTAFPELCPTQTTLPAAL